jgi:uncharacterized repeat protein (TIGR03803 family)
MCKPQLKPRFYALALLVVSGCGGGDGGDGTPPPTVTEQVLYSFGRTSTDAMGVGTLIRGSDGNFYGTTYNGGTGGGTAPGTAGNGTVFRITPTGEETILHLFAGGPNDGANPSVLIQGQDGNFYGTTSNGGANYRGTAFKLTPEGVETILYSFGAGTENPSGGLLQGSDGNFYGTTEFGGASNLGSVFKLTPEGVETLLYSFKGGPDGTYPAGQLVVGSDGNFYGVTPTGGSGNCPYGTSQPAPQPCGTVYKVTPQGVETVLYFFSGPDGAYPNGGLVQGSDGNFYGTTIGGSGSGTLGTVFEISPEGTETTLVTFTDASQTGANPQTGLVVGSDGNFYGATGGGGANASGTMFQLTPAGALTVLFSFQSAGPAPADQAGPQNLLAESDGSFYGTTAYAGAFSVGYFFKLTVQ